MAESKRHHYVPRFYLRNFTDAEGLLHVYDKDADGSRLQTPENTTVKNRFYGFYTPDGCYNDELERTLATLESRAKEVLDRWRLPGAQLAESDLVLMSDFLAVMHVRVPRTIAAAEELMKISAFQIAKIGTERPDLIEEFLEQKKKEGRPVGIDADALIESLENAETRFTVEANPKIALAHSLEAAPALVRLLVNMNWCLCRAPTDSDFITSDSPLCVFCLRPDGTALLGGGFGLANVEVHFPISPSLCVRIGNRKTQQHAAVSRNFVDEANKRTAANAERFIISNRSTTKIAGLIDRFKFTRNRPKLDRTVVADIMGRRLRANLERNRPKKK